MQPKDLAKALEFAIKNNFPILIKGAPGLGKTDIMTQACKAADVELIISHPVVSDPTDFKGLPFPTKNANGEVTSAEFLPFGDLNLLLAADKPTVYFLDDLGQSAPVVQAACMQLILARRINGHIVSPHVTFMAATNRREDKAAVQGILEPVKSRFYAIIELEVNAEDWEQWAWDAGMPFELIAFLRFAPSHLVGYQDKSNRDGDMVNKACPRTIAHVGEMFNKGLPKGLELEMVTGAAGSVFATEFISFLRLYRELPDLKNIYKDPQGTKLPGEPSQIYAICGALANAAKRENFSPILSYVKRMENTFQILFMKEVTRQKPHLGLLQEAVDWAVGAHKVVL